MKKTLCIGVLLIAASVLVAPIVDAKTLRWSSQGDVLTMDPHSQNEGLNNSVSDYVYEPLVTRGKTLAIEPALAVSWQQVNTTTTRFKLRPNVRFHDGASFTSDDVVFSIQRALADTSRFRPYLAGVKRKRARWTTSRWTSSPRAPRRYSFRSSPRSAS